MTRKAVKNFQQQNALPVTGEPDAETVAMIEHQVAILDASPFKKKSKP